MILNCAIAFYLNLLFEDTRADNLLSSTESYQKEVATNASTLSTAAEGSIQPDNSNHTTTRNLSSLFSHNRDALIRGFYVFGGLCVIVLFYFGIRSVHSSRRKNNKRAGTRRYIPLSTGGRDVQELVPFDGDDDDEDTLFDTSRPSNLIN